MAQTRVYLTTTGAGNWTVPTDCNLIDTADAFGGAGSGAAVGTTSFAGGGAGGGFSRKNNVAVTPSSSIPYSVGTGGLGLPSAGGQRNGNAGADTWMGNVSYASAFVGAKAGAGGVFGLPPVAAQGGQASGGIGDTKFSGGNGGNGNGGNGGGGAGGPNGNGTAGASGAATGGNGGSGDAGFGGAGGTVGSITGGIGTEYDASHGSGGGGYGTYSGGGAAGISGKGGLYGAGSGSASGSGGSAAQSDDATQGMLVLTYTPIVPNGFFLFIGQQSKLSQSFFAGTLFCSVLSMRFGKFIRDTFASDNFACAQ